MGTVLEWGDTEGPRRTEAHFQEPVVKSEDTHGNSLFSLRQKEIQVRQESYGFWIFSIHLSTFSIYIKTSHSQTFECNCADVARWRWWAGSQWNIRELWPKRLRMYLLVNYKWMKNKNIFKYIEKPQIITFMTQSVIILIFNQSISLINCTVIKILMMKWLVE